MAILRSSPTSFHVCLFLVPLFVLLFLFLFFIWVRNAHVSIFSYETWHVFCLYICMTRVYGIRRLNVMNSPRRFHRNIKKVSQLYIIADKISRKDFDVVIFMGNFLQ